MQRKTQHKLGSNTVKLQIRSCEGGLGIKEEKNPSSFEPESGTLMQEMNGLSPTAGIWIDPWECFQELDGTGALREAREALQFRFVQGAPMQLSGLSPWAAPPQSPLSHGEGITSCSWCVPSQSPPETRQDQGSEQNPSLEALFPVF